MKTWLSGWHQIENITSLIFYSSWVRTTSTRLFGILKFSIFHKALFHKRRHDLFMKLFVIYVKISYFHNVSKMPQWKSTSCQNKENSPKGMGKEQREFKRILTQYSLALMSQWFRQKRIAQIMTIYSDTCCNSNTDKKNPSGARNA